MDENEIDERAPTGRTVSDTLRQERERQGMSRKDLSDRTKISERHLIAIDEGDYSAMPSRTYIIGFVRSYANALGLDSAALVQRLRDEMGMAEKVRPERNLDHMEPGDPERNPSRKLTWIVLAAVIALVVVVMIAWRGLFVPAAQLPPLEDEQAQEPVAAAAPAQPDAPATDTASQEVVFTATVDGVWVKFYDRSGNQLFQKQMALNESFTIPADAEGPQIWTGRPDALKITVGGREVPPLAEEQSVVRDIPVDAAALRARPAGPGLPQRGAASSG